MLVETGRVRGQYRISVPANTIWSLVWGVFHHIVHENGIDAVRQLLDRIMKNCSIIVEQTCSAGRALVLGFVSAEDPRTLLETIAYAYELARHGTYLGTYPSALCISREQSVFPAKQPR